MDRSKRAALGVSCVVVAMLAGAGAAADETPRMGVEWRKLMPVLQAGPEALLPIAWEHAEARGFSRDQWIGTSPRLSLIARDWADARRLVGRLALTDQLRPARSNRMMITRVRLADGRLGPFAQLGVGEWRADTILLPTLPNSRVLATQLGAGFELELSPAFMVALELDWTLLSQEDAVTLAATHANVWGSFIAARIGF